jgi:alkanesulfonate monooxygenase SsuD/methylene tetrahydromethanopterin reductase-like flavin-dependent oxidoreductase (luciferase family)
LGEKNVEMTAEIADGWIPVFFVPSGRTTSGASSLAAGRAKRDPSLGELMISAGGLLAIGEGEDVTRMREFARPGIALYVGGMGAKGKNFYNELMVRYGFEKEAATHPGPLPQTERRRRPRRRSRRVLRAHNLCGPKSYVAERVAAFREAGVSHLQVHPIPLGDQSAASLIDEVKSMA